MQVLGGPFTAAYTGGDNYNVVATDTMKNFVLEQALAFEGSTLEAFLDFLGRAFLMSYPDMKALHLTGRELRFEAALVPEEGGFTPSTVLFARSRERLRRSGAYPGTFHERRRPDRPRVRAARVTAAKNDRQLVFTFCQRQPHDPARNRRPPALHLFGRVLALRRRRAHGL